MKKTYDVILMDADGTLFDFDKSEAESFQRVLEKYGLPPQRELVEEYHRINKACWEEFEDGKMVKSEVLTVRFERFFSGHGLSVDGRETEEYYRGFLSKSSYLIEGALSVCEYLKEKYAMYIVTNGVASTQHGRLKSSGLAAYFEDIFVSEEAGSQKPQKEFFDYCFNRIYGCAPGPEKLRTVLLVGDSLTSDIRGGVNAGVDTCWYNPNGEENKKGISVTYEIGKLEELMELL